MEFAIYAALSLVLIFPLMLIGTSYIMSIRIDELKDMDDVLPAVFLSLLFTLIWPLMLVAILAGLAIQKMWYSILTYLVPYSPPEPDRRNWWYADLKHLRELETEMREATSAASTPDEVDKLLYDYYRRSGYDYGTQQTLRDLRIRILDERIDELERTK